MNENRSKSPKMNGIIKNIEKPVVQNEANRPNRKNDLMNHKNES